MHFGWTLMNCWGSICDKNTQTITLSAPRQSWLVVQLLIPLVAFKTKLSRSHWRQFHNYWPATEVIAAAMSFSAARWYRIYNERSKKRSTLLHNSWKAGVRQCFPLSVGWSACFVSTSILWKPQLDLHLLTHYSSAAASPPHFTGASAQWPLHFDYLC